jgi:hypothetical protein
MVTYRAMTDGDLMQIHEGREVGRLGVKLAPDTQDLFVAAPEMLAALKDVTDEGSQAGMGPGGHHVRLVLLRSEYERIRAVIAKAQGEEL